MAAATAAAIRCLGLIAFVDSETATMVPFVVVCFVVFLVVVVAVVVVVVEQRIRRQTFCLFSKLTVSLSL